MKDLDSKFGVDLIKAIYFDSEDSKYYILHNKFENGYGLYLFLFNEDHIEKSKHMLKVKNRLKIDDALVSVIKDEANYHKELIIAYKTIYLNTYTIKIMDLASEE